MADSAPVMIWISDVRKSRTWFNKPWLDFLGRPMEQVLGAGWLEGVHPKDLDTYLQTYTAAFDARRTFRMEYRLKRRDGEYRSVLDNATPLTGPDGTFSGYIGSCVDITDFRLAEAALRDSEERFRTLADNMSQFAWMADAHGWIFWYNRRWYEYTGTTLEDVEGWGWQKVHHPDHLDRVTERLQYSWDTGEEWEDIFPLRGADGNYRWFLSRALPIRDSQGRIYRWLGTNTDVTARREAEEALKEADRRKDEFLAMLAHELRNPLAPIRTGLDILAGSMDHDQETVGIMQQQVEHVVRLVDDLLDVSRIMLGKIELRRELVELAALVKRSVAAVRPLIESRRQELRITLEEEPMLLNADPVRIVQVLKNLLNNASKYTDSGGRIELTVNRWHNEAEVQVKDTGVGIEAELLPRVFDLFTQASRSLDRSQGGLGIGLTLVHRLVEMHAGTITAQSDGLGHGSVFSLRLPLVDETPAPTEQPVKQPHVPQRRRLLVVDDNVGAAWMLSKLLMMLGDHEIATVHDGPAAVQKVKEFRPEIVLLDIGLPEMDGYEVGKTIRQSREFDDVRLIAVTGYGTEEDRLKSHQIGFDKHVVKPLGIAELEQLLAEFS